MGRSFVGPAFWLGCGLVAIGTITGPPQASHFGEGGPRKCCLQTQLSDHREVFLGSVRASGWALGSWPPLSKSRWLFLCPAWLRLAGLGRYPCPGLAPTVPRYRAPFPRPGGRAWGARPVQRLMPDVAETAFPPPPDLQLLPEATRGGPERLWGLGACRSMPGAARLAF